MSDQSILGYRLRGIVMANRGVKANKGARIGQSSAAAIAPNSREDLVFRGGRSLPNMSFKTFYVGKIWARPPLSDAQRKLDLALAAAMSDPALNDIVGQYFAGSPISTTALPSAVLDVPVQDVFDKDDVQALAKQLFMSGALSALDLKRCIINFMLPPGAVLSSEGGGGAQKNRAHHQKERVARRRPGTPEVEEESSKDGLGGYHGSIHISSPGNPITLLYSVAVWSEDGNGIAIQGWEPWENACATLYHELNEARTDPDVEDAIRTGDVRFVGWNSASGKEIGDAPIEEAGSDLLRVFKKVAIAAEPRTVPIQLMWSNRVHGPEAPGAAVASMALASRASARIISFRASAAAQPAFGGGIVLSPPGNLTDFKKKDSGAKWNDFLSDFFDDAIKATQAFLKGLPSQYYNPSKGTPSAPDQAEQPIKWPGFPRLLENSGLPQDEQFRLAESISGTSIGRHRFQDEYLEWFVTRDNAGKITRIDFTCEGPEYWEFLADNEPDVLLALYQKHINPDVKRSDLLTGKQYNPLNVWNTTRGAMHLIQPANSLNAEVRIAGDATILRKNPDGSLKTEAQDLIDCAGFGEAGRASDPHIGDLVNTLARDGYVISIKDPVGLYMSRPRLVGFTTPDQKPITQDWFKIARGSETHILRGVFQAPASSSFVVGDLLIGGVPLAFGGQVAKVIDMGLTGVAHGKGTVSNPAFPCGKPDRAITASAMVSRPRRSI